MKGTHVQWLTNEKKKDKQIKYPHNVQQMLEQFEENAIN